LGLRDGTCDSCGEPKSTLFPVAVLDELPFGGMGLVQKWYCVECSEELVENAKDEDGEEDEEEDKELDSSPINRPNSSSL